MKVWVFLVEIGVIGEFWVGPLPKLASGATTFSLSPDSSWHPASLVGLGGVAGGYRRIAGTTFPAGRDCDAPYFYFEFEGVDYKSRPTELI